MADWCSVQPVFLWPVGEQVLDVALGNQLTLNCTFRLPANGRPCPGDVFLWTKDGRPLDHLGDISEGLSPDNATDVHSSLLRVNLTSPQDYGVFSCLVRNTTASFTLQHAEASGRWWWSTWWPVVTLLGLALLLLAGALLIARNCRLNARLWYRNNYGDFEINDGKLYDAYVSYINSADDRKFVNFIVKPHLENRHGYKLFLDDKDILPHSEPSADLIMNVSRCRRLIVVLSDAYLEQDWCNTNFKEGLWRLLELSRKPIFIAFESQRRELCHPAIRLLSQHRHTVTLLLWRAGSMTPSSDFWKELCLALPRRLPYRTLVGDPQTQLQEDKDPMLTLHGGSYLETRADPDPDGDLGIRGPIFRDPRPLYLSAEARAPAETPPGEPPPRADIDVSDLGSRNYGARTDFYCLVTEDDV
ncbi:single Ig IL-1-related receptor [Tachyglossus aculeatus]|uniref:single Ig IL-1-related receptor n=1 Tax=Tachyglossus aculeatus TaxID=9261 RepID=UPI0018F64557|nr:single Ig IL-1-related receptor [Tachyglossus aculeatus]XP_038620522.1 single Ig IL-1-related receptor [Tachyglossus aculeatus]XP_038620523.1 single Ig IL-1-related receptor [Tachyglossus aculeatus]